MNMGITKKPGNLGPIDAPRISHGGTTAQYFWRQVKERGDQIALRHKHRGVWKPITWRQYGDFAQQIGVGLASLSVVRGEVVSILSSGNPEWLYSDRGIQAIGAISNAIHPTDGPARVRDILADSKTRVCIVENAEQLQKILDVREELPSLQKIVVIDLEGLHNFRDPIVLSFQELLNLGREYLQTHPHLWEGEMTQGTPDEPAVLSYSSSSDKPPPQGVLVSHNSLMFLVNNSQNFWSESAQDVQLPLLPFANLTERVLTTLLPMRSGAVVNFVESADTVDENLREVKPTCLFATPRLWERIVSRQMVTMQDATPFGRWSYRAAFSVGSRRAQTLADGKKLSVLLRLGFGVANALVLQNVKRQYGLSSARRLLVGTDVLADQVYTWFAALGLELKPLYGLSESSGLAAISSSKQGPVGRLTGSLPGTEMKLASSGEIMLRGPHIFTGYLNAALSRPLENGWLRTGDIGEVNSDGSVLVAGRQSDLIALSSGHVVAPAKVEARLRASPYIASTILVGEGREALGCLVVPEHESVAHYAQSLNVPFTNFASLCKTPEVQQLIRREIENVNRLLHPDDRILDFRIIDRVFGQDSHEVTKGVRLDRRNVNESCRTLIDDLSNSIGPRSVVQSTA